MADGRKKTTLPWGMSKDALQPNSVQSISSAKLKAFSLGRMNPLKKAALKKKDVKEDKKMSEAKQTAEVFEEFVASFEDTGKSGKTFVKGSTFNPDKNTSDRSGSGGMYKPSSKFLPDKKEETPALVKPPPTPNQKPVKKKGTEKKKSILELFREELKRAQEDRKDRHAKREAGILPLDALDDEPETTSEMFKVDEYREVKSGSFDSGDSLTTNLYVGNINPKMNEENLCQMFGKFGPLASVKVMWPRTEEERAKNRNCGFVAFMKRPHAEKALEHFKGTTIMDFEVQVGWGKAVPIPPHPIYVPPDVQADEKAKMPDPPSGFPFNAQPPKTSSDSSNKSSTYDNVPPPGAPPAQDHQKENKEDLDMLYNAIIRVVIPTDVKLLRLIHRMIEFVIREGPMFEAMIMNREISNPIFQFLFDNQGPAHVYYRWKLFSILQGDSPETWRIEEFRMFESGSLWKPPPLKNLRMKMLPPVEEEVVMKRGQLSSHNRDDLENQLRGITMERGSIRKSMVWCLDHADSAEEVVDCICEALGILETPLPMKLARLFLVSDILHNCSSSVPYSSNFRRGFESKLLQTIEHFHAVLRTVESRMRAENFKRRVLACLRSWDQMSIYHFNFLDKLRETFIGKSREELEKQKAFDTVAALMAVKEKREGVDSQEVAISEIDGVPLFDDRPIDFSGVGQNIDGVPMDLDGEPLPDPSLDGIPLSKADDIDGVPMESDSTPVVPPEPVVKSKWELVDYGDDSDEEESTGSAAKGSRGIDPKERQQLLAELEEKKRRILRDVEVKVVELSDALESSGSYSKSEIKQRVDKYRDKLMTEAVLPKFTPPSSPDRSRSRRRSRSRSPSPGTLAKYELEESPRRKSRSRSPKSSKHHSPSLKRRRSGSPRKESPNSSRERSRKRSRSNSPSKSSKRRKSHDRSPTRKRSSSPRRRSISRSTSRERMRKRSRSHSPASKRRKSRERSPARKRSSSPSRRRSRSRSPASHNRRRSRSRSPRKRHRSKSPKSHRHRSRSPAKNSKKKRRSRSRSPHKSSKSSKKSSKH